MIEVSVGQPGRYTENHPRVMDTLPGEDAALLPELDEEKLLHTLQSRYLEHKIYTYIGDILIAANPFQDFPIYGAEMSDVYSSQPIRCLPSHIFAVADRAYTALQVKSATFSRNQCIVISGDSGAGKTESTKLLLRHLVRRSRGNTQLSQQILQVNPLLEAFGNAQTVMNQNSSRFGKYIQLRFSEGSVRGAKINEYLLEKSRVSHQDLGERNFHVFYYMLFGCPEEEKEAYGLLHPSMYRYIGQGWEETDNRNWVEGYQRLSNAMRMVGFQNQEELDLKTILSGVLSLGNIVFEEQEMGGVTVNCSALGWLKAAAGQFGVQEEDLMSCLICTVSLTRGEAIRRLHSKQQAEDARDSIARVVYSRMFGWIVTKVNQLLAGDVVRETDLQEIGILDIFGFENFRVNRFEQLCINLANEQLQNYFNHHIFLMEQQHYMEEGIKQDAVTFTNNQTILDLFLGRPWGIFSILDEQTSFPQASDDSFVEKMSAGCRANPHFERSRGKDAGFIIHHYAGKVQYSAVGFLEKNRDALPVNIQNLFVNSVTLLLSLLFSANISRTGTLMPVKRDKALILQEKSATRKMSVGTQFRRSLGILMEKINSANPYFIRCIKPNSQKLPGVFQPEEVLNQLRYNGLMETLRIRRDGFSWRPTFQDFVEQFGIILLAPHVTVSKESCVSILQRAPLSSWQFGTSRIFFKYWHQEELIQYLLRLQNAAIKIQKCYKGIICRRAFQKLLDEMKILKERLKLEELEAERERMRLQEEEARSSVSRPIPLPRKKPPSLPPKSGDIHLHSVPHPIPRPRSQLVQLTPFDNSKVVASRDLSVTPGMEKKQMQRRRTLVWFKETQAKKVLDDGAFPPWLHGMISRRDAENLLLDKEFGDFLIRISQTHAGYILSFRGQDRCRNYMIDVLSNGCYVILGEDRAHPSLSVLVKFHQTVGIQPYGEVLREPCEKINNWEPDYEELKFLRRTLSLEGENVTSLNSPSVRSSSDHSGYRKSVESSRLLPHLHKSIRRAMHEIQQLPPAQQSEITAPEPDQSL
ncbi:myosin-IIIb-like [Mixophyes fleayi]|uniref:myosin-IIIb-like n=1 Tax=Mixophyes fleayi TaxID=3061075 RepID=UPI003F4DC2FB